MAQVEQNPQNGPSAPTPDSLFMEHLKCSICLETLRIPIMTTIGCGHKFCETDIKTALTEDRRCPLCREVVRELFHDVFAEQMLEVYYKQNPNVAQRERCPPWTGPDPLVDVGHTIFGGRNRAFNRVNVQVLAPELPQAERDEISNNIVRLINRENRINELASFDWNGAVGLRPADLIADDYVPFWPPYYDLDSLPQPNPRQPRVRQTARMTSGRASSNPGRGARMSVPSVGGVRRGADASRSRRNAPYGRAPRQTARIRARALSPVSEPRPSRSNNTTSRNGQARQLIGPSYPPTSARTLRYLMREFRDPETIRRLRSSPTGTDSSSASLPRVIRARTPLRAATPRTRRPSTQDSPAPMILRSGRISQRPILYGSNC